MNYAPNWNTPLFPTRAAAVTPSDSTVFDEPSVVMPQVSGDIRVLPFHGPVAITYTAWPANTPLPVAVSMVYATATTATNIVRHY